MTSVVGRTADGVAPSTALTCDPRSARVARDWVRAECLAIGRDELVDCARLAVGEVVTNAVLHAEPPLVLSRGGDAASPYFKVSDGSTAPPRPNPAVTHEEALLATTGRGLALVASCSAAWGAQIHNAGKVVWFQPLPEPRERVDFFHAVIEYDAPHSPDGEHDPGSVAVGGSGAEAEIGVLLSALDTRAYRDFVRHHGALARELRLISLTDPDADPELGELARHCATTARASLVYREPAMLALLTARAARVDVALHLSPRAIEVADDLRRGLDRLDLLLEQGAPVGAGLLVERTSPRQRAFRDWFFAELAGQAGTGQP